MIGKFVLWIIAFVLSFPLGNMGLLDQGKTFLCIYLIASSAFFVLKIIMHALDNDFSQRWARPLIMDLVYILEIVVTIGATWIVSKIFNIDFYVVYQIMTLGQCICFYIRTED